MLFPSLCVSLAERGSVSSIAKLIPFVGRFGAYLHWCAFGESTLHLTMRASGKQVVLPGVVFRGKDWNHSVEKDHYPTDCWNVLFINAWVDTVATDQISDDILAGVRRGRDVRTGQPWCSPQQ